MRDLSLRLLDYSKISPYEIAYYVQESNLEGFMSRVLHRSAHSQDIEVFMQAYQNVRDGLKQPDQAVRDLVSYSQTPEP
jgi:hypothetical protein